jgi:4-amino-4-deoxy-L-arabinose transferase-like glycosyltransferase
LAALRSGKQTRAGPWLFWIGLACGALIKGPIGPLMLILTLGLLAIWERRVAWLRPLLHPPAVAVALLIVLPWTIAIWQATDGRFFTDAIGQDLAPKLSGQSENKAVPPGAHLLIAPLILWPASLLLPAALWTGLDRRRDPRVVFLLAWIIPNWLMFEAAPAKLAHYTLPIHGALVLLGAIGLVEGAWQRAWVRWIGLAFFVLGGAIPTLAPMLLAQDIAPDMTALARGVSAAMALVLLVTWALLFKRTQMAGLALAISACVTSLAIKAVFIPALPQLHLSARVSDRLVEAGLHPRLSPQAIGPLVGYGYQEPSLIFATRSDSALSSQAAAVSAARAGAGFVVLDTELDAFNQALKPAFLSAVPLRSSPAISGTNYSKGDSVTLIVGQIEALQH